MVRARAYTVHRRSSYRVGKRDDASGDVFIADLRARLVTVPQISSDGFAAYPKAVGARFEAVDFSVVHKNYSRSPRRVREEPKGIHQRPK